MMPIQDLRPASVSVLDSSRDDKPIAILVESRSGVSSAVLTVEQAESVWTMLGQLIASAKEGR